MNNNTFRAAAIGVTAGVTAGVVTVAGAIICDDLDVPGRIQDSIARWRLAPAERAEFDRLQTHKATKAATVAAHREECTAATRAGFNPHLLDGKRPVASLEELSVPALIEAIDQAIEHHDRRGDNPLSEAARHLAALRNEFHRRADWQVRVHLPRLDQLRLEAAEQRIRAAAEQIMPWSAAEANTTYNPRFPGFTGPNPADYIRPELPADPATTEKEN